MRHVRGGGPDAYTHRDADAHPDSDGSRQQRPDAHPDSDGHAVPVVRRRDQRAHQHASSNLDLRNAGGS